MHSSNNPTQLDIGKAVRFGMKRSEWCKQENFLAMYNNVYGNLTEKGIAKELDEEVMLDKESNITENEEEQFGRTMKLLLTRPHMLMYVDEVGYSTSQSNDGNCSGTKYVTRKGVRPQQQNIFTDSHFTTLGRTTATGEPIMCMVIMKGAPGPLEKIGYNCLSPDWGGEDCKYDDEESEELLVVENMRGLDKFFPCGPTCEYNEKTTPAWLKAHLMDQSLPSFLPRPLNA
jgi:hypothetical protein